VPVQYWVVLRKNVIFEKDGDWHLQFNCYGLPQIFLAFFQNVVGLYLTVSSIISALACL
jgi:hypothetical protein